MKEKPILFTAEMVTAILDGRKTMTRRIAKPRFDDRTPCEHWTGRRGACGVGAESVFMARHCKHGSESQTCPYGQVGDRLWVREAFADLHEMGFADFPNNIAYRADCGPDSLEAAKSYGVKWRPSIHMLRWASRITLEITSLRAERVRDITRSDIRAEGVMIPAHLNNEDSYKRAYADAWKTLWDSIYTKRGYGWAVNPWVWVISFKLIRHGGPNE